MPEIEKQIEKRCEHRLSCSTCGMSHVITMKASDPRPAHRCRSTFKVAPFDKVETVREPTKEEKAQRAREINALLSDRAAVRPSSNRPLGYKPLVVI